MDLQALTPALDRLHINPPVANPNPNLRPIHTTNFKRETKEQRKQRRAQRKREKRDQREKQRQLALGQQAQAPPDLAHHSHAPAEWPVEQPPPVRASAGWAEPCPSPATRPANAEDNARLSAVQLQTRAVKAFRDFFSSMLEEGEEGECEAEMLGFWRGLFEKDGELRAYYGEKKCGGGEFVCLACGGSGERTGKRFGDCLALVQHSLNVWRTKTVAGHRAFGRAVCGILGWDVGGLGPPATFDLTSQAVLQDGAEAAINIDQDIVESREACIDELMDFADMSTLL